MENQANYGEVKAPLFRGCFVVVVVVNIVVVVLILVSVHISYCWENFNWLLLVGPENKTKKPFYPRDLNNKGSLNPSPIYIS